MLLHAIRRYPERGVTVWSSVARGGAKWRQRGEADCVADSAGIAIKLKGKAERRVQSGWRGGWRRQVVVQRLHATIEEHEIVTRRPHVRSLAVVEFGVHVHVDVLVPRQLLHQRRQAAQRRRFGPAVFVDHHHGSVLVLLVRVHHLETNTLTRYSNHSTVANQIMMLPVSGDGRAPPVPR